GTVALLLYRRPALKRRTPPCGSLACSRNRKRLATSPSRRVGPAPRVEDGPSADHRSVGRSLLAQHLSGVQALGFGLTAGSSTVRGLVTNRFDNLGIHL